MKRNKHLILFALLCCLLICMMALPVAAHGDSLDNAKAAIVIDARTGEILYAHNENDRLPMASTTKIMSALIALESGELDEQFTVDSEAIRTEGSSMGLREGDIVTMRALVCGMLLPSGNDAANAAAVRISGSIDAFVGLMNERAGSMGLDDTHFVTPSGLDDYTDEHYSTAYDMARLTAQALKNEDFAEICSQKSIKLSFGDPPYERWLINTNKLLESCEGVIGVKTGFTDKARRCLVSACERGGATLICVTLNDPDDWRDHSRLYDMSFAKTHEYMLPDSGREYTVQLAGGEKEELTAVAEPVALTLPDSVGDSVEARITLRRFVFAPVEQGEQVGCIRYYSGGRLFYELPIRAVEDVQERKIEKNEWKKLMRTVENYLEKNSQSA